MRFLKSISIYLLIFVMLLNFCGCLDIETTAIPSTSPINNNTETATPTVAEEITPTPEIIITTPTATPTEKPVITPTSIPIPTKNSTQKPATPNPTEKPTPKPATPKPTEKPTQKPATPKPTEKPTTSTQMVWIPTNGGTKYHSNSACSKMKEPIQVTKSTTVSRGFSACKKCF